MTMTIKNVTSTLLNAFISLLQDFDFVLKGLARLLTNPLTQTYLPNSTKKIQFHQELLVLFWKLCDFNKVCKQLTCENYKPASVIICRLIVNLPFVSRHTEVPVFRPEEQRRAGHPGAHPLLPERRQGRPV